MTVSQSAALAFLLDESPEWTLLCGRILVQKGAAELAVNTFVSLYNQSPHSDACPLLTVPEWQSVYAESLH